MPKKILIRIDEAELIFELLDTGEMPDDQKKRDKLADLWYRLKSKLNK